MARIERFACDREGCKRENAKNFQTFHDRRMDGAGSAEDWFLSFDLCPDDVAHLFGKMLDALGPEKAEEFLKSYNIATREV